MDPFFQDLLPSGFGVRINSLKISDLRVIEHLELKPGRGLNFIVGDNGAGKTSILEAIYLAGRGRTFRHSDAGPMIRKGASHATVVIELSGNDQARKSILGVRRERRDLICRLNGEDVKKRSVLAETLPVQWISSQPQLLLGLGPEIRRRFIDMGMFHVEHSYLGLVAEFQRTLKQRNSAIRQASAEAVRIWNPLFSQAALALNARREVFVAALMARVTTLMARWDSRYAIGYRYRPGWSVDKPLVQQLDEKVDHDLRMGFSTIGPQRAELELLADGKNAERQLSRGQQKILVLAMNLALLDTVVESGTATPVLLVDDLAAELDPHNRVIMIEELEARDVQVFLATIEAQALRPQGRDAAMFHVEQGALTSAITPAP